MTHAQDQIPDYILLAHFADDTHVVICHYHGTPAIDFTQAEINDMAIDYYYSCREKPIRFQFAQVKLDTTIEVLEGNYVN